MITKILLYIACRQLLLPTVMIYTSNGRQHLSLPISSFSARCTRLANNNTTTTATTKLGSKPYNPDFRVSQYCQCFMKLDWGLRETFKKQLLVATSPGPNMLTKLVGLYNSISSKRRVNLKSQCTNMFSGILIHFYLLFTLKCLQILSDLAYMKAPFGFSFWLTYSLDIYSNPLRNLLAKLISFCCIGY